MIEKIIEEIYEIQKSQIKFTVEELKIIEKEIKAFNLIYDNLNIENKHLLFALVNSLVERFENKNKEAFKLGFISAKNFFKNK